MGIWNAPVFSEWKQQQAQNRWRQYQENISKYGLDVANGMYVKGEDRGNNQGPMKDVTPKPEPAVKREGKMITGAIERMK